MDRTMFLRSAASAVAGSEGDPNEDAMCDETNLYLQLLEMASRMFPCRCADYIESGARP
jgi:hypothetical protein